MFKRLLIILFILLESGIFYAGSPVMLVRCGRPRLAVDDVVSSGCEELGNFISFNGHCYALPEDGSCPNYPESMVLEERSVFIVDEFVSICVPKCADECEGETCYTWNFDERICDCEEETVNVAKIESCECPFFLEFFGGIPGVDISSETGCLLPQKHCYELGIQYTIEPFVCDGPEAINDTIRIVIKGEGGADLIEGVDALTITDLQNCNLIDDTEELLQLKSLYGGNSEAAFVADAEGCIILEFTRDPFTETNIIFADADTTITIPACPRVFDPCSCPNPNNITDAAGVVEYWYDEMTVIGIEGTPVILKSNNSPAGFLTLAQGNIPNGTTLGSIGQNDTLTVPFLRTPGSLTDLELSLTNGGVERSTFLMSGCSLAVDACVVSTNTIPSLGEWGIIALGLLLLIIGIVSFSTKSIRTS